MHNLKFFRSVDVADGSIWHVAKSKVAFAIEKTDPEKGPIVEVTMTTGKILWFRRDEAGELLKWLYKDGRRAKRARKPHLPDANLNV